MIVLSCLLIFAEHSILLAVLLVAFLFSVLRRLMAA